MDAKGIGVSAVVAALYAALVIVLAPISFGPVQLRVADCLIPLSALLGWPGIVGVTLGCLVGNAYYMLGVLDVLLGPIANLLAAFIIYYFRRRLLSGCVLASLIIGLVVGGYLWLYFPPPGLLAVALPLWAGMVLSITLSSLVAVAVLGYLLVKLLIKSGALKALRSMGLRIDVEGKA